MRKEKIDRRSTLVLPTMHPYIWVADKPSHGYLGVHSLSKAHGVIPNVLVDPKCERCADLLDDLWSTSIFSLLYVIIVHCILHAMQQNLIKFEKHELRYQ